MMATRPKPSGEATAPGFGSSNPWAISWMPRISSTPLKRPGIFLEQLESTQMTRSYKMLVLLAMLEADKFPGRISIDELSSAVERLARRSPVLIADVGPPIESQAALRRHLEENPIAAWTGGRGTGGRPYFGYEGGVFESDLPVPPHRVEVYRELVRELAEFRLAEYLTRPTVAGGESVRFQCRVSHSGGRPILRLPDRSRVVGIPEDWVQVDAAGESFEANFAKIAVNVMRRPGSEENVLPEVLRNWFGAEAGSPGTRQSVEFSRRDGRWLLAPVGRADSDVTLWQSYPRREVAQRFGLDYSRFWEQGVVKQGNDLFLFVTLEKADLPEAHRYGDRFLSRDVFEWQSQNRNRRESNAGKDLQFHSERGITVHLFVRKQPKLEGRGAPFFYCGPLQFIDWEGDQPITVRWRLSEAVPDSLWPIFGLPVRIDIHSNVLGSRNADIPNELDTTLVRRL